MTSTFLRNLGRFKKFGLEHLELLAEGQENLKEIHDLFSTEFTSAEPAVFKSGAMKASNHYDTAFEWLLRTLQRPYVSVNEQRRALFQGASLKSMDFVVYSKQGPHLLVDVKGRKFEPGTQVWESWTTEEDVHSLMQWQKCFGDGFQGTLVFAYELTSLPAMNHHSLVWEIRGKHYSFYAVGAEDYARCMKTRSQSWQTVSLPHQEFRRLRRPMLEVL